MINDKEKRIYLDYAASTPLDKRVKKTMEPFWNKYFANPGGIHKEGQFAKKVVENARKDIAQILQVEDREIIFTSGGTESNSLAILGLIKNFEEKEGLNKAHIITSEIEHPSVLKVFKKLEGKGLETDFLKVKSDGLVDVGHLKEIIRPETILISVMYVNNEVGTIQPIKEISEIINKHKRENFFKERNNEVSKNVFPIFHTDASQAPLFLNINPHSLGVDMMTIDGQKIYGPKGVGFLYKARNVEIEPILLGGSQERGLRPGTENTPLIVGLTSALEYAQTEKGELSKKIGLLQDYFIKKIKERIKGASINGSQKNRISNNVNISIEGYDSERAVIELDQRGIAVSNRSACIKGGSSASYVLDAMSNKSSDGIRFTLGRETSKGDLDRVISALEEITKN